MKKCAIYNLAHCSFLNTVAVATIVTVFLAGQATDTYAGGKHRSSSTCEGAWSKQLTYHRFKLVMPTAENPRGEAVLDKETCLVWEQSPDLTGDEEEGGERLWTDALEHCFEAKVGGRYGWRMPTIEELTTLLDDTVAPPLIPDALKAITSDVQASGYWSSTSSISDPDGVWHVRFQDAIISDSRPKDGFKYVWCVRGGQGHDAY